MRRGAILHVCAVSAGGVRLQITPLVPSVREFVRTYGRVCVHALFTSTLGVVKETTTRRRRRRLGCGDARRRFSVPPRNFLHTNFLRFVPTSGTLIIGFLISRRRERE